MKNFLSLLFFFKSFLIISNTYSTPLHGSYTIGTGGDFVSIDVAINALETEGISGPVKFRIFSGSYHQSNYIRAVANSNSSNTITFESFANNVDSVIITAPAEYVFRLESAKNVIIRALTLQNISMHDSCQNIQITDNKFNNYSISVGGIADPIYTIIINRNTGLGGVTVTNVNIPTQNVRITDNDFSPGFSSVFVNTIENLTITNNTNLGSMIVDDVTNIEFSKNQLKSNTLYDHIIKIRNCSNIFMTNNFISNGGKTLGAYFNSNNNFSCANNTFRNEGPDTTLSSIHNTIELVNNIYYNDSDGVAVSIYSSIGVLSDYNTYYNGPSTEIIQYNGIIYTLSTFQSATSMDLHSKNRPVNFVNSADLHLHPSHSGDEELLGAPHSAVSTDIDGQPRHDLYPYMGADELNEPLPVELSSFTSLIDDNNVTLHWTTSLENNNAGFEVERKSAGQWQSIGFVNGNGNSNITQSYFYRDMNLNNGIYNYRLKQIDFNGNFEYQNLMNEVVIGVPAEFSLSQNYPNPFNPETKIRYSIPTQQHVRLMIYDLTGKEILTIVNEIKSAGWYEINFNASTLSSGIYFYKIDAGVFEEVKKMIVVK